MSEDACSFREARIEDLFLLQMCCKEFLELIPNFSEKLKRKELLAYLVFYKNDLGGSIVGFIDPISTSKTLKPIAQIIFIFINPSFRTKGLGKGLLNFFIDKMRQQNLAAIRVELFRTHNSGIKFFEQLGFKQVSEKRGQKILQFSIWDDFGIVDESLVDE